MADSFIHGRASGRHWFIWCCLSGICHIVMGYLFILLNREYHFNPQPHGCNNEQLLSANYALSSSYLSWICSMHNGSWTFIEQRSIVYSLILLSPFVFI